MKTPLLGQAYVARSVNAADNRLINLFPEAIPAEGKEAGFLSRTPGLRLLTTVGTGPIRALYSHTTQGDDCYIVSGDTVYQLDSLTDGSSPVTLGTVSGTGLVSIADNGTQIMFVAEPDGYIYNETTSTFSTITDPDWPGAVTVAFVDGYFVFNEPDSQKIWITSLYDGTDINALEFASAEGSPDLVVAVVVDHRETWVFGTNSIEVWYDSGNTDFPLQPIQGAFMESGLAAAYSVAKLDNSLFWLGRDARGQGQVYRAKGYGGVRISTHAVEYAIAQYGEISDAVAFTYQQEGHAFYVLTFPVVEKTWVYDVSTEMWHERAAFVNGVFTRWRGHCQMSFKNEIVVGDYENGNLYALDLDVYADNSVIQKYLRSWRALPPGQNNLKRSAQHSLQVDVEAGVGLVTGQGSDPQMLLRWSDDGGHTWSNYHQRSIGKIGVTGQRAIWRRLGMTMKLRDRVYEISGTDPNRIAIMGAELYVTPTNA